MSEDFIVHMFREAFYTALLISAPVLLASLVVGLVISVFQAATSVQEFTLSFVPKIVVVAIVLVLMLPWMMETMIAFTQNLFQQIPTLGH
ncbi:MAG TPA: flagellar biosynthetic protein FliQ [Bacteroidetes bacterium]|jgi:flagellar biosynthesis protein FliQ|nr:flagellar biosynthetic protein FliQ [Bacteroidota bacterium]